MSHTDTASRHAKGATSVTEFQRWFAKRIYLTLECRITDAANFLIQKEGARRIGPCQSLDAFSVQNGEALHLVLFWNLPCHHSLCCLFGHSPSARAFSLHRRKRTACRHSCTLPSSLICAWKPTQRGHPRPGLTTEMCADNTAPPPVSVPTPDAFRPFWHAHWQQTRA